jgi:hypothetical protein
MANVLQHFVVNARQTNDFLLSEAVNPWNKLEKDYAQLDHFNLLAHNAITILSWEHVQVVANFPVVRAMGKVLLLLICDAFFSVVMLVLVICLVQIALLYLLYSCSYICFFPSLYYFYNTL